MRFTPLIFTTLLLSPLAALAQSTETKPGSGRPAFFEETVRWQNQEENAWPYHVYGLVRSTQGTLLAPLAHLHAVEPPLVLILSGQSDMADYGKAGELSDE